jgi:sugar phosphate isomerase/epimerase
MANVRFGISTHLYHHQRLTSDHLRELAAHGFDRIELFATRSHFDYHDDKAIRELEGWLREHRMSIHSIHAPIVERHADGQWIGPLSLATRDETERARAVAETAAAIGVARHIPVGFLVVHLGHPDLTLAPGTENSLHAATKSLQEIAALATPAGVRVAVEVIPNRLSSPETLVRLLEEELDLPEVGICLDFGHASLMGDLADAIETVSGLLTTTHVHDNRGKEDEHLPPFEGATDWDAALMSLQKVGYEGTLLFEVAAIGAPASVLGRTQTARKRFEALLDA